MRRCRNVPVERAAAAIGSDRIDEVHALLADRRLDVAHRGRGVQGFVGSERHVVVEDGVAYREGARVGPRESSAGNDRPMVRHVYDAGFIAFR